MIPVIQVESRRLLNMQLPYFNDGLIDVISLAVQSYFLSLEVVQEYNTEQLTGRMRGRETFRIE